MLKIRLARAGRTNLPFFRIVLTDHTKSCKSGYKEILGNYDPIKHKVIIDTTKMKEYIKEGAQVSERAAKLAYNESKDEIFKKFFEVRDRKKTTKNPDKYTKS